MAGFLDDLETRLRGLLDAAGLDGDLDDALAFSDELSEDELEATELRWFVLSEALASLGVADQIFAPPPELLLLLRYLAGSTEPVDHLEILIDFPFADFPARLPDLCEAGTVVAIEDGLEPGNIDALVIRAGVPGPGESGTATYHVVTRDAVRTFAEPLAFVDALAQHA